MSKKIFYLLFTSAIALAAAKNIVTLSSSTQMQGGNSLPFALPTGVPYGVQGKWTGSTLAGNIKLQASIDQTTWFDIANSTQTVSGSGSYFWNVGAPGYPFSQLVYTPTSTNAWTVASVADAGVAQSQQITMVADTCVAQVQVVTAVADVSGSLNNTWFYVSGVDSTSKKEKDFYVWFNINSAGTDPGGSSKIGKNLELSGLTAVPITGATNASANTLGGSIATALAALNTSFASASNTSGAVTITSKKCGAIPAAADGPSADGSGVSKATGFTFATPSTAGVKSKLNNTWFSINPVDTVTKAVKPLCVWNNISSLGTNPCPGGYTATEVDSVAAASAGTVATNVGTVLAALTNDFASATASSTHITAVNANVGAVAAAADGTAKTGFTFVAPGTAGVNSLNNTYFTFYSANNAVCYYYWINVDSLGTDPAPAGCTAATHAETHGATASTIGGHIATAIAALNASGDFSTSGSTTVTVTNLASGPSTFPVDSGTGFTFAGTTGAGTLTSYVSY